MDEIEKCDSLTLPAIFVELLSLMNPLEAFD